MSKTNYAGIDYAAGQTVNRDKETGIRYGIISQHHVAPEALDDIFSNGTDMDFAGYIDEAKDKLRNALSDYFSNSEGCGVGIKSALDNAVDNAFDAISDGLSDNYQVAGDCTRYEYECDGYKLMTDSSGDLWVIKSPFFTYAQFCSPCAPGACYLSNPLEPDMPDLAKGDEIPNIEANKCYCLGADWFSEESPCPYTVYDCETGKPVWEPGHASACLTRTTEKPV